MGEKLGDAFEEFVGLLDYPMFIVTANACDENAGCLVGFATQSSIDPPRFLVGLSQNNHTYSVARAATHLGVHLITRDDVELARLFGSQSGDHLDKFSRCAWHRGPTGVPILEAACAWFVGSIVGRFDLGDHVGHLLEPVAGYATDTHPTFVSFADVKDLDPGHQA